MTIDNVIDSLDIIKFKYLGQDRYSFGFKAQDVEKIFPKDKYTVVQEDNNGYLMVDYSQMSALLFQYCKQLKKEIEILKKKVKD